MKAYRLIFICLIMKNHHQLIFFQLKFIFLPPKCPTHVSKNYLHKDKIIFFLAHILTMMCQGFKPSQNNNTFCHHKTMPMADKSCFKR